MRIHVPFVLAAIAFTAAGTLVIAKAPAQQRCHASYPDFCIAPAPPDLNCRDITGRKPFRVRHDVANSDPHEFDRDGDGRGCEPPPQRRASDEAGGNSTARRAMLSSEARGYHIGPRGGCYTYSASGRKRYVDRSYCN